MSFDEFLKKLGLRIKFLRMSKGLNQADLASLMSSFENNLSNIETGKKNISAKTIYKIAQALEVEPSKLFDFQD